MRRISTLPTVLAAAIAACAAAWAAAPAGPRAPQPGDIYREYSVGLDRGNLWRVTDPEAKAPGAKEFLPNPVNVIAVDDLEGAVRAEAGLDRWGGHPGTSGKRMRFNGNGWLDVPEVWPLPGPAPASAGPDPRCYMVEDNPAVEVPLAHLKVGENTFEGTSGGQVRHGFDWGQWGWYGVTLRVYYRPGRAHPTARVVSPRAGEILGDTPVLRIESERPERISRVDYVAWYEGIDEDGDGDFAEWHEHLRGTETAGLAGTSSAAPFEAKWDARWVPDAPQGNLRLLARVRGTDGVWWVTDPVDGLGLRHRDALVKLYRPAGVPEAYWVRAGKSMGSRVPILPGEPLDRAREAVAVLRTWNGAGEEFRLNDRAFPIGGANHRFAQTLVPVPPDVLRAGENKFEFRSATEGHGVEILWPGPYLLVRYAEPGR